MLKSPKNVIALMVVALYMLVVLFLLVANTVGDGGDIAAFFEQMNKANFLLGPVGFVMGHYFRAESK